MADDESWLYGEEGGDEGEEEVEEPVPEAVQQQDQDDEERPDLEEEPANEGAMEEDEDDDDDDSDDDIEITIDKDKIEAAKTTYQTIGLKKNNVIDIGFVPAPQKEKKGRFAVEEFDSIGTINGQPSVDHDVEAMEDKPWRKPGADITDYFNYGFTEDTWQAYCNRQKKMRMNESGAGLLSGHTPIMSTNKYSGGNIPILGGSSKKEYTAPIKVVVKDSTPSGITVMTHDKRIYSQKVIGNMDFSVPPPGVPPPGGLGVPPPFSLPPPGVPPPGTDSLSAPPPGSEAPPPMGEFPPGDPFGEFGEGGGEFYGGYEPTAEAQWSVPPPANHWTAPPGESHYHGSAGQDRYRRRDSREERPRDWDRSSSSAKRRSRSRSRERDRRSDRDRRERGDRDREREREREDRDRRIKKEKRSRSRSRSPKHKKSKKDKKDKDKDKDDKKEKDGAKEIKEEPKD